jgi:heat shock protein HslJ
MRRFSVLVLAIAATLLVAACNNGGGLTGKTWQLTAITEVVPAFQGVVPEADQANYTIMFNTDGSYNAKADCNQLNGTYTTTGTGGISIELGAMTMAMCPEESLSNQFVAALGNAESYAIADSQLTLTDATGGTLVFK